MSDRMTLAPLTDPLQNSLGRHRRHLSQNSVDHHHAQLALTLPTLSAVTAPSDILILYIIGKYIFADPRATLFDFLGYKLSWVEVLLVAAAIMAMAEQIKVAKPGINNTTEVLLMGLIAIIQVLLFALGAAKVPTLAIFDNTEFLLLTLINLAQTAVAYQINSATLMRTISPVS
jgi:hypothetical protein